MKRRALAIVFALGGLLVTDDAGAQTKTVTVPSGLEYERSELWTWFFGDTWRDVWKAEITVPVIDLASYAGGLRAFEAGGNQSRTLRLKGEDGRTYMFRSVNKDVQRSALPEDLRHTPAGNAIQDQTSSMHPSAPIATAVLQEALGLLYAPPTLYYLPDDERLGEWREVYANSLGFIEERPEDEEDGSVPFAGAKNLQGTDKLLEDLEESMEDRFESRDYLTARLLDFIVGDTDRGADQWRFAKFERGKRDIVRPIPRDRDYAFMNVDGIIPRIAAMVYPKLTRYTANFPALKTLVFMTREFDRSHLVDISRAEWDSTVAFIQQRLTDDVIDRAVARLPEPHQRLTAEIIREGLRTRRDHLGEIADEYYAMVNNDADIFASDEDERAEIDRNPDGTVRVRLWREDAEVAEPPVFDRTFTPVETDEIRVYLERGKDYVVIRGDVERSIEVRVVGGEDDDVLLDSSIVRNGDKTHFYDAHGDNTVVRGGSTSFTEKPFVTAPPKCSLDEEECAEKEEKDPRILMEERRGRQQDLTNTAGTFIDQKTKLEVTRSWGKTSTWSGLVAYRESDGVILGFGPSTTDYGFRRFPHEWKTMARLMVGTRTLDLGGSFDAERQFENSPWSIGLYTHASQLESNRFFGYGNNSPLISRSESLIPRNELLALPQLRYDAGQRLRFVIGPEVRYVDVTTDTRRFTGNAPVYGTEGSFGQVGASANMTADFATRTAVQQRGVALDATVSAFPKAWDVQETFTNAAVVARAYVPVSSATIAVRAGGEKVWGTFPLHEAAFIGGNSTLRGYSWNRFAGDAATFGAAELRLPLFRITLLTRGQLGIIGFTEAGRVWTNGDSDGGWHTSYGGGLWFGSLGQAVNVTYAKGEQGRFYVGTGLPF